MRIVKSGSAGLAFSPISFVDANGNLVFGGATASASNLWWIGRTATANRMEINNGAAGGQLDFTFNGVRPLAITGGTGNAINFYNAKATAGVGVVPIYAAGVQTLYTNVAPTTLSYTPPATAGVYRLSGFLNALTAGTLTFRVKITYTDAGGTAQTDIPGFVLQNTTAIIAGGNTANTVGRYWMISAPFGINNGAAAITIQDNAGTYTAGTYYWNPILEQLA